jgi:hypothetical protein
MQCQANHFLRGKFEKSDRAKNVPKVGSNY